jgi:hypothetical protein
MIEGIESTQLKAWAETPLEERASTFVNRTSKFYDEELPKLLKEVLHETTDVHNNAASSFIAERKKLIERLTAKPIKDLPSEIEPALKSETSLLTAILG